MDGKCLTCRHWAVTPWMADYADDNKQGECSEIRLHLDIELKTGWDGGYVDTIETDGQFGCAAHEEVLK